MSELPPYTVFFDCDNTLLNNDRLKDFLDGALRVAIGDHLATIFWELYEKSRASSDVVDLPGAFALLRPRISTELAERVWNTIWNMPYDQMVYPDSIAVIEKIRSLGYAVGIVSDGDQIYQPHKIQRSGLAAAVHGKVKIYVHKQQHVQEIQEWLPARRYIMVDDKLSILSDLKHGDTRSFITVHIKQGHYAQDLASVPADIELRHIGDLLHVDLASTISSFDIV